MRWHFVCSVLFLLRFALASCAASDLDAHAKINFDSLHQKAPPLAFEALDNGSHSLKEFFGKPILLHLWASWCEPCRKEIPELAKLSSELSKEGIQLVFISADTQKTAGEAKKFWKSLHIASPYLHASLDNELGPYQAWGLPMTYLIDEKGVIRARLRGSQEWNKDMEKAVVDLLHAK